MNQHLKRLVAAAGISTACLISLSGCGGSDSPAGDGLTDMQRQDRDASASISGLFAFGMSMIASMTSDSHDPRAIDGITPPVSEVDEPAALP
jgi:hypothetical protein